MITGLLLTRNRPDFLFRALNYYHGRFHNSIVILDASDDVALKEIRRRLGGAKFSFPVTLLHHDVSGPCMQRLLDGIRDVSTPYVMLMADDDFYYCPWIEEAVGYLETHPACGTAYGHVIIFELDGFVPFGAIKQICNNKPNPVLRWMEHESPVDRIAELGRGAWGGNCWYSIQRTQFFRKIAQQAHAGGFPQDMFERTQSLLQAINGKVVMLDSIYVARQVNMRQPSHGFSYKKNQRAMEVLAELATEALMELQALDRPQAEAIVRQAMRPEIDQLKLNDFRGNLKFEYWKSKMPWAGRLVRSIKRGLHTLSDADPLAPDARFPTAPVLAETRPEVTLLKEACRMPATASSP
jgi:glycosyltransferase domain-containing protein